MIDLATVTAGDFEALVDRRFERLAGDGGPSVELTLTGVSRGKPSPVGREPFSLTFVGPAGSPFEGGIQPLRHRELGDAEVFLTPVGADAETRTYQAVFG